jgi:hypothetical protein
MEEALPEISAADQNLVVKPKPPRKPRPSELAAKAAKLKRIRGVYRPCRVDIRLTRKEKATLERKAKATKRTITSFLTELIAKVK